MTRTQKRFTCSVCAAVVLTPGGTAPFYCAACRVARGLRSLTSPQYLAHKAVAKARRAGLLADPRSLACADCCVPASEYDHRDYSKPLAVEPVCRRCNRRRGPAANALTGI